MQTKPIIIVDDDNDDIDMFVEAAQKLNVPNKVLSFSCARDLTDYLKLIEVSPLFILCDVNLAGIDGFHLREQLMSDKLVKYRSVPFLFWSTCASDQQVQKCYDISAQGIFTKSASFHELCSWLACIISYWNNCMHPKKTAAPKL